jgi:23S rRNA (adenine2030-N6)-methyltransferase
VNYRHHYHAGNFADVMKHVLLLQLVQALQQKEKGFLYLDTHAGRGSYDLAAAAAGETHIRTSEWPDGLGRLWALGALGVGGAAAGERETEVEAEVDTGGTPVPRRSEVMPKAVADYVARVRGFDRSQGNVGTTPRFYPGSPMWVSLLARAQERLVFCERQPDEVRALQERFQFSDGVQSREVDGYGALKALLPPLEKRALVLIDPPFEAQDEWARVITAVKDGLRRLPGGVYAVWYPLTERAKVDLFFAELRALNLPPTLAIELWVNPPLAKMKGCGLLVVNPPWKFDGEAAETVEFLAKVLAQGPGARGDLIWIEREK